jgi:squalene-hopene/tetraprenyl-beta-curcumene cyclase
VSKPFIPAGLFAVVLLLMTGPAQAAEPQTVRDSVSRALPFIVDQGNSWIEERDCTSCHRISFMTWSLTAAADAGFDVNLQALEELRGWSRDDLNKLNEKDQKPAGTRNLECVSHILWAERKLFDPRNDRQNRTTFLKYVEQGQQDDGLWKAGGQLPSQRRPGEETNLVSTMWHALALGTSPDPAAQDARRKAMIPIEKAAPGSSTESIMLRVLLAIQSKSNAKTKRWVEELKSRQNTDGSWSWVENLESDPMATGMALYALKSAGTATDDKSVQSAVDFLISQQSKDGSWPTPGTKKKAKGKPVETSTYWGTCWSVIGLTAVLDK